MAAFRSPARQWPTRLFPRERQIVQIPLKARIAREMPDAAPIRPVTNLVAGAEIIAVMRRLPQLSGKPSKALRGTCIRPLRSFGSSTGTAMWSE